MRRVLPLLFFTSVALVAQHSESQTLQAILQEIRERRSRSRDSGTVRFQVRMAARVSRDSRDRRVCASPVDAHTERKPSPSFQSFVRGGSGIRIFFASMHSGQTSTARMIVSSGISVVTDFPQK